MRKVDRASVAVPKSVRKGEKADVERQKYRDFLANRDPKKKSFTFSVYKEGDVRRALEDLFHGKCAYCETLYAVSAPVDIEHYRPKSAIAEAPGHGGYWWIAGEWTNLLPSCIDCNRRRGQTIVEDFSTLATAGKPKTRSASSGKKDSFPIITEILRVSAEGIDFPAEGALLIDPCREDPADFFEYNFDPARPIGLVMPKGDGAARERAIASIKIFGLNRLRLVQDRTEILRRLEFLASLIIDLAASIMDLEEPETKLKLKGTKAADVARRLRLLRDRTLDEIKGMAADEAPYSAMVVAWIHAFEQRIGA